MTPSFEELAYEETPMGALSLRRRTEPALGVEIFEVKLGDAFLMSSLFTAGEIALADEALGDLDAHRPDVVVAGLGLGYTACAALDHPKVATVLVIEALPQVIEWHRNGLVPQGRRLADDPRCRMLHQDFFGLVRGDAGGLDTRYPGRRFHAVLLDIDHSPRDVLHPSHRPFYEAEGLRRLAANLHPGGVFGLWSDAPPDAGFLDALADVFESADARVIAFHNPLRNCEAANTVYVARTRP